MNRRPNWMTLPLMVVAAVSLLSACHSKVEPAGSLPPSVQLNRVLVVPFMDMHSVYGENVAYTCPLYGQTSIIGKVAEGADGYMTRLLYGAMEAQQRFDLTPPG